MNNQPAAGKKSLCIGVCLDDIGKNPMIIFESNPFWASERPQLPFKSILHVKPEATIRVDMLKSARRDVLKILSCDIPTL